MSFNYTNLVTDRTAADVERAKYLRGRVAAGTATEAETAEWATALKGTYNASDLNRVNTCMEDLVARLNGLGYAVPGYQKIEIARNFSRLPEGYTAVEYIQSSGTQYVNTGVLLSAENIGQLYVHADIEIVPVSGSWTVSGVGGGFPYAYIGVNGAGKIAVGNGTGDQITNISYVQGRYTWDYDLTDRTISVEGLLPETVVNLTVSGSASKTFYISAYNSGTSAVCHSEKVWGYSIYVDNILIRDFVPCKDPSGAAGLYDLVNSQFYGNAGTGSFAAGPEVPSDSDAADLDPYTWYERDTPTENDLTWYLQNVEAVRRVLTVLSTTPATPESMADLTVDTANDIEEILVDISRQLDILLTTYIPCGEAICGGDNL